MDKDHLVCNSLNKEEKTNEGTYQDYIGKQDSIHVTIHSQNYNCSTQFCHILSYSVAFLLRYIFNDNNKMKSHNKYLNNKLLLI